MPQPLIPITREHALLFAGFLVLYEFLTYIANDMIMPGMLQVIESFQASKSDVATSLTMYVLGGASLQLILGPLSDRFGRRPVMLHGALLFLIFTIFIACANSMTQFLLARFLQGMGLCFISVVGYATLQEIFSEIDAIRLISVMTNVSTLAPLIGPLLGAVFIYYFNWRIIFVIIAALAALALGGLWQYMPESVGQTTSTGIKIKRLTIDPKTVIKNYKFLLISPNFMLGSLAAGLLGLPCLAWIALAPIILVDDANLSIIQYGIWQLPVFSAAILGNVILRIMIKHRSLQQITFIGSGIIIFGSVLCFILTWLMHGHYLGLMPGLIIYFFGLGLTGAPLNRFILFSTTMAKGTSSALMSMTIMCVQALGIEIANKLYINHNNSLFGFFCVLIALIFTSIIYFIFGTKASSS